MVCIFFGSLVTHYYGISYVYFLLKLQIGVYGTLQNSYGIVLVSYAFFLVLVMHFLGISYAFSC